MQPTFDFDQHALVVAPSRDPRSKQSSADAAIQAQPKRATQNAKLMTLLKSAGEKGLSDLEIQDMTGWLRQTICARRYDLRSQLVVAETRHEVNGRKYSRWRLA